MTANTLKARKARQASTVPQELKLRAVLDTFRSWGKIVIPVGLVLGITGAVFVFLYVKPSYEAVAWLKIDEKPTSLASDSGYAVKSEEFVQT